MKRWLFIAAFAAALAAPAPASAGLRAWGNVFTSSGSLVQGSWPLLQVREYTCPTTTSCSFFARVWSGSFSFYDSYPALYPWERVRAIKYTPDYCWVWDTWSNVKVYGSWFGPTFGSGRANNPCQPFV